MPSWRPTPTGSPAIWNGSGKNSLCFSCFLMNYPEEAIELVVVHELCHIKVRNHGPDFYALLEQYLPDHKEQKKLLK